MKINQVIIENNLTEDPKNWRPADPNNFDSDNDFYNARDQEDGKEEDWYDDPEVDPDAWMTEAGNANSGRRGPDYQDNSPVIPGRVEPLPQGLRHHADASRYGGTEPDDEDDRLLSPQQRHRLHRAVTPGDLDEQEKIAGRYDPDDFDDMIGRLKHLAGAGPLKTVYDTEKRVYKNVPHAVQPAQQPKKAQR